MGGRCTICSHIHKAKIDQLVNDRVALKHIAKRYHVTIPQLWRHNMRCADRKLPPAEVPQPPSPQPDAPIKDLLVKKLLELAQNGDSRAILELLSRPSLYESKPAEDPKYELTKLLNAVESRAMRENSRHLADQFEAHVHHRLEMSGEHALARRWEALDVASKDQLWQEIMENLRGGSSDGLEAKQAVQ